MILLYVVLSYTVIYISRDRETGRDQEKETIDKFWEILGVCHTVHTHVCIYIYIYIERERDVYREREREREREMCV